jgi:putative ABC transport system permease protein
VRGELEGVPDAAVRGFRLGLPVVINSAALATIGDMTSPLPGLGTFFRYKVKLTTGEAEAGRDALEAALADPSWTIRTARDGLGPMVRYYDLFIRFLVVVGLASLLVGGISVWTGISAYVAERANVIAILRSVGAGRGRILLHFFVQVAALAAAGIGIGLAIGASLALLALPAIGQAVGVPLAPQLHVEPLLVAGSIGMLTATGADGERHHPVPLEGHGGARDGLAPAAPAACAAPAGRSGCTVRVARDNHDA